MIGEAEAQPALDQADNDSDLDVPQSVRRLATTQDSYQTNITMKYIYLMSMLLLHTSVTVAESPASAENKFIQELDEVVVQNIKEPAGLSYRQVLKALDAYDKHHGLAPFAPARFKVQLNRKQWDASREPLTLRLVSSNTAIDIPVAADKTFSIPRNRQASDDDAKLVLNRSKALYNFVSWIESPDIPDNARRLGDLRLQCEMNWTFIDVGIALRAAASLFGNPCQSSWLNIGFLAPRPLNSATLLSGKRRETLAQKHIRANGRIYNPPLSDQSWSDDTLVELEFAPPNNNR